MCLKIDPSKKQFGISFVHLRIVNFNYLNNVERNASQIDYRL